MTQPLTAMDTAIIDRWLARQEGMPPGDALGATIVRNLREQMESLTARAVRAERRAADLEQDRSDVWRTLGIAQDADADAAIDAIIAQRAPRPTTP